MDSSHACFLRRETWRHGIYVHFRGQTNSNDLAFRLSLLYLSEVASLTYTDILRSLSERNYWLQLCPKTDFFQWSSRSFSGMTTVVIWYNICPFLGTNEFSKSCFSFGVALAKWSDCSQVFIPSVHFRGCCIYDGFLQFYPNNFFKCQAVHFRGQTNCLYLVPPRPFLGILGRVFQLTRVLLDSSYACFCLRKTLYRKYMHVHFRGQMYSNILVFRFAN